MYGFTGDVTTLELELNKIREIIMQSKLCKNAKESWH